MKSYIKIVICGLLLLSVYSCNNQDSFTESIFGDVPVLDSTAATYPFDKWLYDTYMVPYNLEFLYKMQDVGSDISFNLVPATLDKSEILAVLVKYLWFDVYSKVVSEEFLKYNGPRIIHLIGSAAYYPNSSIYILGTAEGGMKVTLYTVNQLDTKNMNFLNDNYFHVMHHEFTHILNQKKSFPKDFETFSAGYYDPAGWNNRTESQAASIGCISTYASAEPREDIAETISLYITMSDAQWKAKLALAANPGTDIIPNNLTIQGDSIIKLKLAMCGKWLKESWNVDLKALHDEVQEREKHIDEVLTQKYW